MRHAILVSLLLVSTCSFSQTINWYYASDTSVVFWQAGVGVSIPENTRVDSIYGGFERPGAPFYLWDFECAFNGTELWDVNDSIDMYDHWIDVTFLDLVGPGGLYVTVPDLSVVWDSLGVATSSVAVGIPEWSTGPKEVIKVVDLMGRETTVKPNTPFIFIYSDGTRERVLRMDE